MGNLSANIQTLTTQYEWYVAETRNIDCRVLDLRRGGTTHCELQGQRSEFTPAAV
jgi:hypothetical protein